MSIYCVISIVELLFVLERERMILITSFNSRTTPEVKDFLMNDLLIPSAISKDLNLRTFKNEKKLECTTVAEEANEVWKFQLKTTTYVRKVIKERHLFVR